jgi:hypothetical protein
VPALALAAPTVASVPGFGVAHGETWQLQVWHRDAASAGGAGLTDALAAYFR